MSHDVGLSTSSSAFFEAKYQRDADPWGFSRNAYEQGRYDAIISAIAERRYRRAYEPGCSIGVLTERLAQHCDEVYAVDFSPTAARNASERCAHLQNVQIHCGSITELPPARDFDLLLLSEIGYYFSLKEWQEISNCLVEMMPKGATVLAAHWLGQSEDHSMSGDQVHEILGSHPLLCLDYRDRNRSFRLDRWVRL